MLEVSLLGIRTVLRLKRNAWSMVKWLGQATNEYPPSPGNWMTVFWRSNQSRESNALRSWHFALFDERDYDWWGMTGKRTGRTWTKGRCALRGVVKKYYWCLPILDDCEYFLFVTIHRGCRIRQGMHGHDRSSYHRYYLADLIDSLMDDDCSLVRE